MRLRARRRVNSTSGRRSGNNLRDEGRRAGTCFEVASMRDGLSVERRLEASRAATFPTALWNLRPPLRPRLIRGH